MFKLLFKIFLNSILILLVVGIYFYQFHTFEIMPTCVSSTEFEDLNIPCSNNNECIDQSITYLRENIANFKETPEFIQIQMTNLIKKTDFCEKTCKIRKTYQADTCLLEDERISVRFKGKEGLKLVKHFFRTEF